MDRVDETYEPFLTPVIGGQYFLVKVHLNLWWWSIHKVEEPNLTSIHNNFCTYKIAVKASHWCHIVNIRADLSSTTQFFIYLFM